MKFGESLRNERDRQGVSLEGISAATKVSVRHLAALEQDNDSELPGGVFNRGFVQSYCRCLGLDEHAWLERYSAEHAAREPDWTGFAEAVKRSRAPAEPVVERRWWGVLLMFLALGALAWAAWHYVVQPRMGRSGPVQQQDVIRAGLDGEGTCREKVFGERRFAA